MQARLGDKNRQSENSPAIAYHNNLMEESFRRTEMVNGMNQAQRDKY